ncbi:hypothetical protein VTJ04DRAFT_5168 [Mycothermus thermophilus]|uniref:uncharacterized protein n=1 Tax=Humicola insolens TaxID=85995 RepID=UPI00374237D3
MTDTGLGQNQVTTILNALVSIDHRLSRIESALKIPNISTSTSTLQYANPVSAQLQPVVPALQTSTVQPLNHPNTTTTTTTTTAAATTTTIPSHPISTTDTTTTTTTPSQIIPLEPPPEGFLLSSRARMQEELDAWTLPRGYSMRIAGAKVTGKRKVRWVCFRGGEARHQRERGRKSSQAAAAAAAAAAEGNEAAADRGDDDDGMDDDEIMDQEDSSAQAAAATQPGSGSGKMRKRKPTTDRASKKCGCPFRFEAVETARDSDVWVVHYPGSGNSNDGSSLLHKTHNHGPSDASARDDPRARKLPSDVAAQVDEWLREGWTVGRIQEELRARGFVNVLNTDLYNRKRLLKKATEGGQGEQVEGGRKRVVKTGAG